MSKKLSINYSELSEEQESFVEDPKESKFLNFLRKHFKCLRKKQPKDRLIFVPSNDIQNSSYPKNVVRNQRYSIITFLPLTLLEQFSYFYNLYFLATAISQFFPPLKVGYAFTYWLPLLFVVGLAIAKEGYDDFKRWKRDCAVNSELFDAICESEINPNDADAHKKTTHDLQESNKKVWTLQKVKSEDLHVGQLVVIHKNQRFPADLALLYAKDGSTFVKTDQLDGETDWKLKRSLAPTQSFFTQHKTHLNASSVHQEIDEQNKCSCATTSPTSAEAKEKIESEGNTKTTLETNTTKNNKEEDNATVEDYCRFAQKSFKIHAEPPRSEIYEFCGTYEDETCVQPLGAGHMVWCGSVHAGADVLGVVVFTGTDTRTQRSRTKPRGKRGKTELEINTMTKVLFVILVLSAFAMILASNFSGLWFINFVRFIILFSAIIPISMRVNLDLAKLVYAFFITRDRRMCGALVRNSTVPEELGRVSHLFTDKTGTLTRNCMVFKKLKTHSMNYQDEDFGEIKNIIANYQHDDKLIKTTLKSNAKSKDELFNSIRAISLCHNVTPCGENGSLEYQASSPDEVALVTFAAQVGSVLESREINSMTLSVCGVKQTYSILHIFPFSSALKRMGIIVRDEEGHVFFFVKGADVVMEHLVKRERSDWMAEETMNMAREGLRTLVFAQKELSEEQLKVFSEKFYKAQCSLVGREEACQKVVDELEQGLDLICVTAVEDKLQEHVRHSLEVLRGAGIRVWMLTGDKVETAACIARSSSLVPPSHDFVEISESKFTAWSAEKEGQLKKRGSNIFDRHETDENERLTALSVDEKRVFFAKSTLEYFGEHISNSALLIDGNFLQIFLDVLPNEFAEIAKNAHAVVCCRCSPTQKAGVVSCVGGGGAHTCAVGDGGNDVSMLLAADVGVGLEGKEGMQASLAADFSLTQFQHLTRLLFWHGRNSYKRTAKLAQFIIHRGLIITIIQIVFSAMFYFAAVAIYQGMLLVGYSTFYTMVPVFSLVLDYDVSAKNTELFPEIYASLRKGRNLSFKSFFIWVIISIFQGFMIMFLSLVFFEDNFQYITAISFTALILVELLNTIFEIHRPSWNWVIISGLVLTFQIYAWSLIFLRTYFDLVFVCSWYFWWRVLAITLATELPIIIIKRIDSLIHPTIASKIEDKKEQNDQLLF